MSGSAARDADVLSTMLTVVLVATTAIGLAVGSFLTVVATRVPQGASVVRPRSRCDACGTTLTAADLVPVASWMWHRGRCRYCETPIGIEPLAIEISCAALWVLLVLRHGITWHTAAFAVLATALTALSAIDIAHHRLPREISYTALAISAPLLAAGAVDAGDAWRLLDMALLTIAATATMGALHVISRRGLGDGDVRLTPLLAAHLGWFGGETVAIGLLAGFVLGALAGIAGLLAGRFRRDSEVPFGPFLAAGALLTVLAG